MIYKLSIFIPFIFQIIFFSYQEKNNFDVLHYDNSITLSEKDNTIRAQSNIKIKLNKFPNPLLLNFKDLLVDSVLFHERNLKFTQSARFLEIENPYLISKSDTVIIGIYYSGIPQDGLIIKENKYGRKSFFADNWPNRAQKWFPCKDDLNDKATVSFKITAPDKYLIIANGEQLGKVNNLNRTRTTYYLSKVDIPTYGMVFGASEFKVISDSNNEELPITYWLYEEDTTNGKSEFKRARNMVKYYSMRFGEFPFSKLALVQSSTIFGGMENPGAIFFNENSIGTSKSIEKIVAHEIAHQWFGDYITESKWSHL